MASSFTVTLVLEGAISAIQSDSTHALHRQIDSGKFESFDSAMSVDDQLCRLLDLGQRFPAAALTGPVDLDEPAANIRLRADPVYMDATAGGLTLTQLNDSDLNTGECNAFVEHLNAALEPQGLQLRTGTHPGRWYLQGARDFDVVCCSPYSAQTDGVDAAVPTGTDGRELMALMSSLQIELHDLALNEARIERGQVPINGVWIWGQGAVTGEGSVAFDTLFGNHPFFEAVDAAGLSKRVSTLGDLSGTALGVAQRDQAGFATLETLLTMIEQGKTSVLTLLDPVAGSVEIRRQSWIRRLMGR